ncbi:hypothetical protein [Shewanella oncorhynchi]|uniref:hypothetical protein n=1 Tax=Shewanella oncorhynchi TaxID=2726434 RepID=UPI003D7C07F7
MPKIIRINATLLTILIVDEKQQLTVTQIKSQMVRVNPSILPRESEQIVRRTLSKLSNIGFLEKITSGKRTVFEKTSLFDITRLMPSKARLTKIEVSPTKLPEIEQLQATLHQYQEGFHGCIGEAEELKRLYEALPSSKINLFPRYLDARNRGSTLAGKIKAIEAYLTDLKGLS